MNFTHLPEKQGLYDPAFEHDACGVGFVCHIKGLKSNAIIKEGLEILKRMEHRGAVGADPLTGDGAGLLIQIPHKFFKKVAKTESFDLPDEGFYGTGMIFLPQDVKEQEWCVNELNKVIKEEGQTLLAWREVPTNDQYIGKTAKTSEPVILQVFIGRSKNLKDQLSFERKLFVIRKVIENRVNASSIEQKSFFYIPNLSSRTFIFKGMLMTAQVEEYFKDINDPDLDSAIALVHSRFSTNTFPTWDLAQPFRFLAHNGEINTLRGNVNWMRAREGLLKSNLFDGDLKRIFPVVHPGKSDSATFDMVFELLQLSGRSLIHSIMLMVPPAWEQNKLLDEETRGFYQYNRNLMEAWDGPAAIAFTDGTAIGAILDRNGLRPARYIVTNDDMVIMASEVGVSDIPAEKIKIAGRLIPGTIFYIDTKQGRIIWDDEIKKQITTQQPYLKWVKENTELIEQSKPTTPFLSEDERIHLMKAFGFTREDLHTLIEPMSRDGKEPIGSMGNDTPHAVLSANPQPLYNYFKQLFAQVTNPAIDPIREEVVMSTELFIGPEGNLFEETPEHARRLWLKEPVLTNETLEKIKKLNKPGFKTKTISTLFSVKEKGAFMKTIDRICDETVQAIQDGYTYVVLSDRGVNSETAALPTLLAVGAVHQHLIRKAMRTQLGLIVESAEIREVHHFNVTFGYGADALNPYLAFEAVASLIEESSLDLSYQEAIEHYLHAVNKGMLKIISKIGISTLQSYKGAQIFEAVGISDEVISRCFEGTASRIGGIGFDVIEKETLKKHRDAFPTRSKFSSILHVGGFYKWRSNGEKHLWNPGTIANLQDAVRNEDVEKYKKYAELVNDQKDQNVTFRSLLKFKKGNPIPIEEVEPVSEIVKRFATGAMSFGSISKGAHENIAIAMNRLGAMSNTGEGGEDPTRFQPLPNGDSKRSKIKQVASGRFGVTTNYLVNADEIQIKIAQGAKPGEGGQLPGHKVSTIIARTRYTTPGVTLISPPPHHDIYSIEDLAQLIYDLKNTNPKARVSVKLVSEVGVGTIAAGVAKGHADMILISGGDGGTGAAPLSSIKHVGLPFELGISETHQTLVLNNLRSRVRLQTDGQMRTGRDIAIATLLGAEEYGFSTAALIASGCVMLRHCNLNNCSVGIATQDELLQHRFGGRPEYIVNYFRFVAREMREIMAELGFRTVNEMVGRSDMLEMDESQLNWKTQGLDFSKLLYRPDVADNVGTYKTREQNHAIESVLDRTLIEQAKDALENGNPVVINSKIKNTDRTTGAMLSGEICKRYGENGLYENTITVNFKGSAGQSFGAFLVKGVQFNLEGMSNDYVGKGMFGGKLVIKPYSNVQYKPEDNILIGNTTFYGAIAGEAYIQGRAGERFCVRNSGVYAVVEGVGDHGCEYMTGGRVVVLGSTGRNFGAGMSGGVAYVYDPKGEFPAKCNQTMVDLEKPNQEDLTVLHDLIQKHAQYTESPVAARLQENFAVESKHFVKVMPIEYKRIIEQQAVEEKLGLGNPD